MNKQLPAQTAPQGPCKRIIARLDIKGPNLIKGLQFEGNRVLGLAAELSEILYQEGIDELFYQDAVASLYARDGLLDIIESTSKNCFVPLTVAGGIRSLDDIRKFLRAGADRVAINTAGVANPNFLKEAVEIFGSQCVVASIEAFKYHDSYFVWLNYGRELTKLTVFDWATQVEELGVGEIFLSVINRDGLGVGFDIELVKALSTKLDIPIVASSGSGCMQHVVDLFTQTGIQGAAIASMFHYYYCKPANTPTMTFDEATLRLGKNIDSGNIEFLKSGYGGMRDIFVEPCGVAQLKSYLSNANIPVR